MDISMFLKCIQIIHIYSKPYSHHCLFKQHSIFNSICPRARESSHLSGIFCISDESIKTVIDNFKVLLELPLPGDNPPRQRNIPVWNVESRSVLSFKKSAIYCLKHIVEIANQEPYTTQLTWMHIHSTEKFKKGKAVLLFEKNISFNWLHLDT